MALIAHRGTRGERIAGTLRSRKATMGSGLR